MTNRRNIDNNLKPYKLMLPEIKKHIVSDYDDIRIRAISKKLRIRARSGENEKQLIPEAYAAVYETVKFIMGITPFDVQLLAAAAMTAGRIIEMPTGEGKTLTAVFTAYLGGLSGKGVHVLTFNDYLAKRDAIWMKPVYESLGLSVRYINENMNNAERKEAYNADVTYLTAKEAGFDYLRRFLAYDRDEIVQRPFNLAIVDEADSILIDEAKIPLVIAGDIPTQIKIDNNILAVVSEMHINSHFVMDEYADNISLTETGADYIEKRFGIDNLYETRNLSVLTKVNVMLQAVFLLKKDIDYIIRNNEVLLVDEFTGRVMKDRQWPDGLQAAVEIKEGLIPKFQGTVMNRITIQNFLRFYPRLCGMTGTAYSAAPEFNEFYGKTVTMIPPNKNCIRIDKPDIVFTHKEAKYNAVAEEIVKVHKTGRPILAGTCSIEDSEYLADLLRPHIRDISVLNARNDAEEAEIIENAGKLNAVTISTNMAGRGVDIVLGGKDAAEYSKVRALGGLYVIGTNRYESIRIDDQLRGRAGRQGDPGESRFFISLEDDLLVKYRIGECIPEKIRTIKQNEPLQNSTVNRAVEHIQKFAEGQSLDAKITLSKYSHVSEAQRKIVHEKREQILYGNDILFVPGKKDNESIRKLIEQVSENEFKRAQRAIMLYAINQCWADQLLIIENALDEVRIISRTGQDPFLHYNKKLISSFESMENNIYDMAAEIIRSVTVTDGHIDTDGMGIKGPSSTRTYMVNDGTEQQGPVSGIAAMTSPLYMLYLFGRFLLFRRNIKRSKNS